MDTNQLNQELLETLSRLTGLTGLDLFVYIQIGFKQNTLKIKPRNISEICEGVQQMRRDLIIYNKNHPPKPVGFMDKLVDVMIPFKVQDNTSEPSKPSDEDVLVALQRLKKADRVRQLSTGEWVRSYSDLPKPAD